MRESIFCCVYLLFRDWPMRSQPSNDFGNHGTRKGQWHVNVERRQRNDRQYCGMSNLHV